MTEENKQLTARNNNLNELLSGNLKGFTFEGSEENERNNSENKRQDLNPKD